MFPEGFIRRIKTQKYIDAEALLRALEEPSPVSIRTNSRKWNRKPLNSEPVPWSDNGYYLETRPSYTLDPLFHAGCYYPQEASGMFTSQAFRMLVNTPESIRVLDLCGAPGGKSIIIADLLNPESLLVANEVIKSRASVLAETLTKWGTGNAIVTQSDPSSFSRFDGYFDIILVDAPCSGEGMFRTAVARDEWSESNAGHCSERQKRILIDVWPALKENGVLIYSTCTFNPGENEENIKWLLDKQKAESVKMDVSDFIGIKEIDYQGIRGYGFYPDKIRGEGFFISLVRKTEKQGFPASGKKKIADFSPSKNELQTVRIWTGLPDERLLKWGEDIWGLPCSMDNYINLFQSLRIVKAGTKICTVKNQDYLPSHELALSDLFSTDIFPSLDLNYEEAIAFLRRDSLRPKIGQQGWTVVKFMGINIGWVKNLVKRMNNYYPVEWRIRMGLPESGASDLIKWY
jgi:16S rRNA C967 or C1407 C5-methylase (RsmB/RsmF family)/NOL1/NOP2/fmu family ribosome biogenesis protein